jgi:hypothetical protein
VSTTTLLQRAQSSEERAEIVREAITMMLYVSVVEIAELAALPETHISGRVTGPVGGQLLAIVWGTAVGLAIAHWFAFRLAARAYRGEGPTRQDNYIGLAQVGGAMFVAALSSLPVLFLSDLRAQEFTGDVPAILIGIVRVPHLPSHREVTPGVDLLRDHCARVGVLVATVKSMLAGH